MKRALLIAAAIGLLIVAVPVVIVPGSPPPQGESTASALVRLQAAIDDTALSWDAVFVHEVFYALRSAQWSAVSLIDGDYWAACPVCGHREAWSDSARRREPSRYWGGHSRTCEYQLAMDAVGRRHRKLLEISGGRVR